VDHVKGFDLLLSAIREMKATHGDALEIACGLAPPLNNRPELLSAFASIATHLGAEVHFNVDAGWLTAGNVCVIPSRSEAACLVAHEATARGLFVVAYDVGDMRYVLDHGRAGRIVGTQSARDLAAALDAVLTMPPADYEATILHARRLAEERAVSALKTFAEELNAVAAR
jgi:glycosyltransferase involved in cell wall biosynthesis